MTISITGMEISYDKFVNDVARRVVSVMKEETSFPELISQRKAFKLFGRANVERWKLSGKIHPIKRPGKLEYRFSELRRLHERQQDYL